jgi:hypothetical protein
MGHASRCSTERDGCPSHSALREQEQAIERVRGTLHQNESAATDPTRISMEESSRMRLYMALGSSIALLANLPAAASAAQDKLPEDDALKLAGGRRPRRVVGASACAEGRVQSVHTAVLAQAGDRGRHGENAGCGTGHAGQCVMVVATWLGEPNDRLCSNPNFLHI